MKEVKRQNNRKFEDENLKKLEMLDKIEEKVSSFRDRTLKIGILSQQASDPYILSNFIFIYLLFLFFSYIEF